MLSYNNKIFQITMVKSPALLLILTLGVELLGFMLSRFRESNQCTEFQLAASGKARISVGEGGTTPDAGNF